MFERYKTTLLKIIYEVLPGCKVYLFGSRARKEHDVGADIDIALDLGKPIEQKSIFLIAERIEECNVPLLVDLVDLQTASKVLKEEIENEGILWES